MKISYMSDLHLEFGSSPLRESDIKGDVLVLCGDISSSPRSLGGFIERFSALEKPIIVILGNHELYGMDWNTGPSLYKEVLDGIPFVHFLENGFCIIEGVRFLGSSLWTDFAGGRQGETCEREMSDFSLIKNNGKSLTWRDASVRHKDSLKWLSDALCDPHDGKTVIVTHTAPSYLSNSPRFASSQISGGFCSNLEAFIECHPIDVWIHGHLHNSSDYEIGKTRVLCNPYGYEGIEINPQWNPQRFLEI